MSTDTCIITLRYYHSNSVSYIPNYDRSILYRIMNITWNRRLEISIEKGKKHMIANSMSFDTIALI